MNCIETELGWNNAFNLESDMATMPAAMYDAMNIQEESSDINQCVPDSKASIQSWAEGCGYDPEATGQYFGKTLDQMMEVYLEDSCVLFTFLNGCSKI